MPQKTSSNSVFAKSDFLSGATVFNGDSKDWVLYGATPRWPQGGSVALNGSQAGTSTLWMRFNPDPNGPQQPPDTVSVLVTVTGQATATASSLNNNGPTGGNATPSQDYKLSVSVSVAGVSGSNPTKQDGVLASSLNKRLLRQVKPELRSDGNYYIKVPIAVNNTASVEGPRTDTNGNPYYGGAIDVGFNASMVKDDRSVTLSREGAIGERIVEGVTHGDTLYSYNKLGGITGNLIPVPNVVKFTTAFSGQWGNTYWRDEDGVLYDHPGDLTTEQWSPNDDNFHILVPTTEHTVPNGQGGADWVSNSALPAHRQEMPFGNQYRTEIGDYTGNWKGSATGESEKIITFEISDTDGASSRSKYVLHLHDEWEKVRMTNSNAGQFRTWETLGTDIPQPDGRLATDTGAIEITYEALPAETKLGIEALNTLTGLGIAVAGEFPGGSIGGFLFEEVYGTIPFPEEETVTIPLGSEKIWPMWQKAKDTYLNPHSFDNQLPMVVDSPIEPEFIRAYRPEQQGLIEAALSDQGQDEDLLWGNAQIVGVGRRTYIREENYNVDHYSKAGFLGVKSFSAFKRTRTEEIGIFKTRLPEEEPPPIAGMNALNFSAPSEGNYLDGAPTEQMPERSGDSSSA